MGIRPKGLGLRLKSRQDHPTGVEGCGGARWPFDVVDFPLPLLLSAPLDVVCSSGMVSLDILPALAAVLVRLVKRVTACVSIGERLRVRARRNSGGSGRSSSGSSSRGCGVGVRLRAAERVTGPM